MMGDLLGNTINARAQAASMAGFQAAQNASVASAAYRALNIEAGADDATIRKAFAEAVKADHPDNGGTGKRITELKKARDYLLSAPKKNDAPLKTVCKMCGGKGTVPHGMESRECSSCGGTGATSNAG